MNKKVGRIRIGKPIRFDANNAFSVEKERLKKELQERIWDLYCSMEADGGLSKEPLFATDQ